MILYQYHILPTRWLVKAHLISKSPKYTLVIVMHPNLRYINTSQEIDISVHYPKDEYFV